MKYCINNLLLLLVLTTTLFFIKISNAIIRDEYNCAVGFLRAHGNYTFLTANDDSSYLGLENVLCDGNSFKCLGNYIVSVNLYSKEDVDPISVGYFNCFFNLSSITLDNFLIDLSLLNNDKNYFNSLNPFHSAPSVSIINPRIFLEFKASPYLSSLYISFNRKFDFQQLSYGFANISNLVMIDNYLTGGLQNITIVRNGYYPTSFPRSLYVSYSFKKYYHLLPKLIYSFSELFSKNLPDFTGYKNILKFKLDLQNHFEIDSIIYFKNYTGIDDIEITTRDLSILTNQSCFFDTNGLMGAKKLKLKIGIDSIKEEKSWGNYPFLTDIELTTVRSFTLIPTGSFQFKNLPPLLTNFKISGSNFSDIVYAFSLLKNVSTIDISDNLITSKLPEYHNLNKTKNLNLSNNSITGSIPQSYCTIPNINFSNNNLNGLIPNCFICFMKNNLENNFLGNNFTNKDSMNNYCGVIEPSLRIDGDMIYLEGKNLGFDSNSISSTPYIPWKMEIASTRFSAIYQGSQYQLFDIYFQIPNVLLKARATQIKPYVAMATVFSNNTVIFVGTDFTYDKTLVSINVSSYYCNVISTTFSRIECILSNEIEVIASSTSEILVIDNNIDNLSTLTAATDGMSIILGDNMKTVVRIQSNSSSQPLESHISINYDPSNNGTNTQIIPCPEDCNNNGLCISKTGICQCNNGFQGTNCSSVVDPGVPCPTSNSSLVCSGFGTCNSINGYCTCFVFHNGHDCSLTQCIDPSCSGFGYCNTTNGQCKCDSSHQGTVCSLPFVQCPTSNNADCNGYGNCNNQTGICACDTGRVGSDCRGILCTIPNCSGHGYCDNIIGKCNCDSSHQGDGCEMELISCPTSNKAICSGSGTCNNQTGICTCDSGRIGSDCSGIQCFVPNCSGHGYCDNIIGKCNCDSSHQGDGCEMELISCPTSNKAICSGSGTCNNQTGICTCDTGRVGNDCSGILCTIPNCSGHGYCDNIIGKCNCDSSHQGDGCEMELISCPTSNKAICSGSGTCNNQTGICTCDSGRIGSDCNGIQCFVPNCNGYGTCNTINGQCMCDSSHQGVDCELNYKVCPIGGSNKTECSGIGLCNNQTGECLCDKGAAYSDCSGILCSVNCYNDGVCNLDSGKCKCTANWKSDDCSIPIHYLSSIDPCTTSGGQVTIYGWFSTQHTNLSVTIGGLECVLLQTTENTIICQIGAGLGTKDVNITQNGSSFIGKNKFQYISTVYKCPKDCSNHGTCDSSVGVCNCNSEYTGFDCSSPRPQTSSSTTTGGDNNKQDIPVSKTEVNIETGAAAINNQDVSYEISIISLVELDYNGNVVKTSDLKNKKWNITVDPSNTNIYQFSQSIDNLSNITYIIEEVVGSSKKYTFAGMNLEIDQGGLKISVSIKNYQYESALNTLQLRFLSSAGESSNNDSKENNSCNEHEAESDTSNIDPNLTLNYISISKNSKILSGRFINKVVSDGRSTFMSTETVKDLSSPTKIVVGLNLPHCSTECFIDPDFSVLVSPNFESSCGNSDSKRVWLIPVAVVVPVVCFSILILGSILIYRKHRYSIRLFAMKKSFSLKQRVKLRSFKK
ncbi:hypothetical protein RB653_010238 [Dictyostelium firmibasis]|uniref:EGF-like domain-containing protein n=1 Tax=Dictyostelium firmibasis TaxID=79012 RepID=A0AAN7U0T4_9MYCE